MQSLLLTATPPRVGLATCSFDHHRKPFGACSARRLGVKSHKTSYRRTTTLICFAGKQRTDATETHLIGVDPGRGLPPEPRPFAQSWAVKGAVFALLAFTALQLFRRLRSRSSLSELEDRGLLDDARENKDPYLDDVMKNVNFTKYDELTEEQIEAARRRRRRARGSASTKADLEIPDNHPFATKKETSPEEQELIKQRLSVKRGLPLQDLSGNRGFPGMSDPDSPDSAAA